MDDPGPSTGSTTPNLGPNHRFERPLPPIPGSELTSVSSGNEEATGEAGPSNPPRDQFRIDTRGLYDENSAEESPDINLHGVDGSLLDIYPSRSNSSLSVTSTELLTRAPYLEGVSNSSPRTPSVVSNHSTQTGGPLESSSPRQREVSSVPSNSVPVSLRDFLGDGPSASRRGPPTFVRSAVAGSSSSSAIGPGSESREFRGSPQEAVRTDSGRESTANVSARALTRTQARTQTSRARYGPNDDSSPSASTRDSPLLSHDSPSQLRHRLHPSPSPSPSPEYVLPRWQPDAEVTFCPICRTQFSFFVRKHHCRKCGRVVCNSCSPHRITIPYQYIVQPPIDSGSPTASEPHPPRRTDTAGSLEVTSLGGGERVRLCNPCVPDPNTAPPVNTQRLAPYQGRHSRSASTTAVPQNTSGDYSTQANAELTSRLGGFQPRTRESSGNPNLYLQAQNQSDETTSNERGGYLLRPDDPQNRSRSSTVGSSRDQTMGSYPSSMRAGLERSHSVRGHPHYRPLIPNTNQSEHSPRMDPSQPLRPPPRRQIPEEDECWVCHQELPSRDLPDWEEVRAAHVSSCLAEQMARLGTASTPSSSPPIAVQAPRHTPAPSQAGPSGSSDTPAAVPNTPEARMAAREQAHAAVVLGRNRPSPGAQRFGGTLFPYQASEKDCVQQAECSICFEEYEPGQDMARLQCFCRFHLHCIRDWYARMPGKCPLHDHDRGD